MTAEVKRRETTCLSGKFRYRLERSNLLGGQGGRTVLFVLNNPSTANDWSDDPTCRRGMGYARAWGFDRMLFGNTNPMRATRPQDARVPLEVMLEANDTHLREMAAQAELVVAAWGAHALPNLVERAIWAMALPPGKPLQALTLTASGIPGHILYLRKDARPFPWMERAPDGRMRLAPRAVGNL